MISVSSLLLTVILTVQEVDGLQSQLADHSRGKKHSKAQVSQLQLKLSGREEELAEATSHLQEEEHQKQSAQAQLQRVRDEKSIFSQAH